MTTKIGAKTKGELEPVKHVDTGDIWVCPECKKIYHLIHREPPTKSETGGHTFEEVVGYEGQMRLT